jgi:hypothetical protein
LIDILSKADDNHFKPVMNFLVSLPQVQGIVTGHMCNIIKANKKLEQENHTKENECLEQKSKMYERFAPKLNIQ